MADPTPPPKYVAYPRGPQLAPYGSVEKLEALVEGYFGLNFLFLLNVVLPLIYGFVWGLSDSWVIRIGVLLVILIWIGNSIYTQNKRIAQGMDWSERSALAASILMAVNSVMLCGIIGMAVMQYIVMRELGKYGVKVSGLVTKGGLSQAIRRRRQLEERNPVNASIAGSAPHMGSIESGYQSDT